MFDVIKWRNGGRGISIFFNFLCDRVMTNKLILAVIILVELAILGGLVYWKFFSWKTRIKLWWSHDTKTAKWTLVTDLLLSHNGSKQKFLVEVKISWNRIPYCLLDLSPANVTVFIVTVELCQYVGIELEWIRKRNQLISWFTAVCWGFFFQT